MKWITRQRPKIDRIACPWLIRRFIDKEAEFIFAPPEEVFHIAKSTGAIPFDIPGAELSHEGDFCSFDTFLKKYQITDHALVSLAKIVRAADTDTLEQSAEAAGLLAISLGLSKNFKDDHEMLEIGMHIYEALYSWCKESKKTPHNWEPILNKP